MPSTSMSPISLTTTSSLEMPVRPPARATILGWVGSFTFTILMPWPEHGELHVPT
jgi:hypothetical protein